MRSSVILAAVCTMALVGPRAGYAGPPTGHPSHGASGAAHGASGATHGASGATHGQGAAHAPTPPPGQAKHGGPTTTGTSSAVPKNPKLAAKLQALLPGGLTVDQAADGFHNQGQFVAAVHVSNNLGIPFAELKSKMLADGGSLGSAIHSLKPGADSTSETDRANKQAKDDLDETEHEQQ